ncbi:Glycosyltransferase involved in cell wall bisynthesis [bacterium A37T11]|nr:Glycosyltransferase involved in cell wall bisynthesis [bacterium A37T11]
MPFISIVIPTYNSEAKIETCLRSILEQSYADVEIIVHDGNSADGTLQKVRMFNDARIRIFSENDSGVYDAMNKALLKTRGEWILFLGSDDKLCDNNTLQTVMATLEFTSADVVYGNVIMSGEGNWIKDRTIYMGETNTPLIFRQNLCHQCILYRKRIFTNGRRYNLRYPIFADHDLNIFCFSIFKMQYIPVNIAYFYTGGLSSIHVDKNFEQDKWQLIVKYYKLRLCKKKYSELKKQFKECSKIFWRKKMFTLALISFLAYLYQKILSKIS